MYKQFILIILMAIALCSCESRSVSEGRVAYKEYFKKTLKDPNSLVIYSEEVVSKDEYSATFVVDMGAKNSYGGMVRSTYTFETTGPHMINVKEYDIRTLPKQEKKEQPISFVYKKKQVSPIIPIESYVGQTVTLSDDALAAYDYHTLKTLINAAKRNDAKTFNSYLNDSIDAVLIKAGEKVTITMCFTERDQQTLELEGFFCIKYKGRRYEMEQSAIF